MEPTARSIDPTEQPAQEPKGTKLVMKGVMTHDRIIGMVEERNPIIANRNSRRSARD